MVDQLTDTILMIKPGSFGPNDQTAVNNYYQKTGTGSLPEIRKLAAKEFEMMVDQLIHCGVNVRVFDNPDELDTPDAVFPNNWLSTHEDGTIMLYPMFAPNRRRERRMDIVRYLKQNFQVSQVIDLSPSETEGMFLEGTGSLVLDRRDLTAYCCLSPRTHKKIVGQFCDRKAYKSCLFHATQSAGAHRVPIYHTNVMMSVGEGFAVVCLESINSNEERQSLRESLEGANKEIVEINEGQVAAFAGNILHMKSVGGEKIIVMSESAYQSLSSAQIRTLGKYGSIVYSSLDTIEYYGGGSARCMIAEIFLPKI